MTDNNKPGLLEAIMLIIAAPFMLASLLLVVFIEVVMGLFMGVCALVGHVWQGVEDGVKGVRGK